MKEKLIVYQDADTVAVIGNISRTVLFEGKLDECSRVLQSALDRLSEEGGGALQVEPGTFPLDQSILVGSFISVEGSGRGTRFLVNENSKDGCGIVVKDCSGARVANLAVVGEGSAPSGDSGIVFDNCGDCVLDSVFAKNFGNYGILLSNNSFLFRVVNCSAAGNADSNIMLKDLVNTHAGDFPPRLVSNCTVYGGGCGIRLLNSTVVNISSCMVYQAESHGFLIECGKYNANSILITGCRTFQVGGSAVYAKDAHELNFSSNVFCWQREHGIVLDNVNWAAINANCIMDNGVRHDPPQNGIVLKRGIRGAQVTGNTVFNWPEQQPMDQGIVEDESCYKNIIANNIVSYYLNRDVVSEGKLSESHGNLSENMAYAPAQGTPLDEPPYDGSIVPIHKMWKCMGPFENEQFGFIYPDFKRDSLVNYIQEEF